MTKKICLVTGATSGLGEAVAQALAERGASVVVVGRNRAKCEATVERLQGVAKDASHGYLIADLSSQTQIRRLADEVRRNYPRIDVLINNAGGIFVSRGFSVDGIEQTFALNHLSYFLLTNLLLEVMKGSAPARIINVASSGHLMAPRIRFDDLEFGRGYGIGFRAYFQSKLANVMFTYELARRLAGTGVTVNAIHPGMVATNIGCQNGWRWRVFKPISDRIFRFTYITPAEAAGAVVFLATAPELRSVTGRYFDGTSEAESSVASRDETAASRLWRVSEEMTGFSAAELSGWQLGDQGVKEIADHRLGVL